MARKFYRCNHCGNLITMINDAGVKPVCCGETMELLDPNTTDAAQEKHVPVIEKDENGHRITVTVGSVPHPMTEEHSIQWIAVDCENKFQIKTLTPDTQAVSKFGLHDNKAPMTVYEYCNLHGLWKAEA